MTSNRQTNSIRNSNLVGR